MEEIDLDLALLGSLRELLGPKFEELITTFNTDCGKRLDRLGEALPLLDFSVIRHESHGVKGSSRNIGANSLAELCGELETKAKNEEAEGMQPLFTAIQQKFAAVAAQLESLL